ncbi:hypothetical protein ZTR_09713 [Talaromyces verruculosus]|nr:hypothetical protein ZTR_09713 [Talaromyces verruculosus]
MASQTLSSEAASPGAERESSVEAARPKRQKIAQAFCGVCAKKRKNKRVDCIYRENPAVDGSSSLAPPTGDPEALHARGDIQTFSNLSIPNAAVVVGNGTDIASNGQAVSSSHDVDLSGDNFFNANSAHKIPSGADSMTGAIRSEGRASFGSSSASSFIKQIKVAVDRKVGRPLRPPLLCTSSLRTPAFHNPLQPTKSSLDYTLPP